MTSTTDESRRTFVMTAGITAAAVLFPAERGAAAEPAASELENVALVNEFCAVWATRSIDGILGFLSSDCVYRMTETTPPATGHEEITARIRPFLESSSAVDFKVLDTYSKGPMVINHRVDVFSGNRPFTWEGVGVFFIKDGKIREWFDYTIRLTR